MNGPHNWEPDPDIGVNDIHTQLDRSHCNPSLVCSLKKWHRSRNVSFVLWWCKRPKYRWARVCSNTELLISRSYRNRSKLNNALFPFLFYEQEDKTFTLKYEDLMGQFEFTLNKIIKSERIIDSFPVIMGVNAFSGVLSEFISSRWLFVPFTPTKHVWLNQVLKMKTDKENRNTVFHTGFKWNSTCFVICSKFAINLSQ